MGKYGNSSEHDEQIVCFDQILNLIRIAHDERMNPILKGQKSSPNVEYIGMLCCVLPLFKLYILLIKREWVNPIDFPSKFCNVKVTAVKCGVSKNLQTLYGARIAARFVTEYWLTILINQTCLWPLL